MHPLIHLTADTECERETAFRSIDTPSDGRHEGVSFFNRRHEAVSFFDRRHETVPFRACEQTIRRAGLAGADVVEGLATVPTGVLEATQLRDDGHVALRA